MTRLRNRTCFTLIETLAVVLILVMIVTVLHGAIHSGVQARRDAQQSFHHQAILHSAVMLIGRDLQRLALQGPDGPATLFGVAFTQERPQPLLRLRLHADLHIASREMLVDYFYLPVGDNQGALVRRSQPLPMPWQAVSDLSTGSATRDRQRDFDKPTAANYEIVISTLRSVEFRYFDGRQWSEVWNSAEQMAQPKLIEIRLVSEAEAGEESLYQQVLPVVIEMPLCE